MIPSVPNRRKRIARIRHQSEAVASSALSAGFRRSIRLGSSPRHWALPRMLPVRRTHGTHIRRTRGPLRMSYYGGPGRLYDQDAWLSSLILLALGAGVYVAGRAIGVRQLAHCSGSQWPSTTALNIGLFVAGPQLAFASRRLLRRRRLFVFQRA